MWLCKIKECLLRAFFFMRKKYHLE
jgi:hypothetical protein